MGQLFDAKLKLDRLIREKNLDVAEVNGKLSLKSGVLLALVRETTPDDPAKMERLRDAARKLLATEL
jgi:hypothetical protein